MTMEAREITPAIARKYLEKNSNNRSLNELYVDMLARDIVADRWMINGSTIVMNGDRLIDGQHRLHAIIKADKSIVTYVVEGVASDAFQTVDVGRKRCVGDILSIQGETCSRHLAAALVVLLKYENGKLMHGGNGGFTVGDIEDALRRHPEIRESVRKASPYWGSIPGSMMIAMHYLASRRNPASADQFLHDVGKGVALESDDPAYVLREKLIANRASRAKMPTYILAVFWAKAWNAYMEGRKIRLLKIRDGEEFPVIL